MKKTIKTICAFLLCAAVISTMVFAQENITVLYDGARLNSGNFMEDSRTYVSVRALFDTIGTYEILWNDKDGTAVVKNSENEFCITKNKYEFTHNGNTIYMDSPAKIVNGSIFVPVRYVASALGYGVSWQAANKTVLLSSEYAAEEAKYSEEDLYWMSRIICSESCIEPYKGKIAVGNVIQNRVKSSVYPNTIKSVIFDKKYGVQFEPTSNKTIYNTPCAECIKAAKECLDGKRVIGNAMYFLNPKIAVSKWIINNCEYIQTIGTHDFYS